MITQRHRHSVIQLSDDALHYPNWINMRDMASFTFYEGNLYGVYESRTIRGFRPRVGTTSFNEYAAEYDIFWRKHGIHVQTAMDDLPLYLITHMIL